MKPELPKIKDLLSAGKNAALEPVMNLVAQARTGIGNFAAKAEQNNAERRGKVKDFLLPDRGSLLRQVFQGKEINYTASAANALPEAAPAPEPAPPVSNQQPIQTPSFTYKNLGWQEHGVNSGLPYVEMNGKRTNLRDLQYTPPAPQKRIKSISIKDPRPGYSKEITDPAQLEIANQIMAVSQHIAPQWTDYLIRLGAYEGGFKRDAINENKDDAGNVLSTDHGPFQVNDKAFPAMTLDLAQDPVKATLFTIAAIQAGHQKKWVADKYARRAKAVIQYED